MSTFWIISAFSSKMLKVSQILGRILHQSGLEVKVKIQDASNAKIAFGGKKGGSKLIDPRQISNCLSRI